MKSTTNIFINDKCACVQEHLSHALIQKAQHKKMEKWISRREMWWLQFVHKKQIVLFIF